MHILIILVNLLLICITVAARRGDEDIYLDSHEDDDDLANDFFSLKGGLRRSFALKAAIDNQEKNMVCSPLSALLPLGKLVIGAKGVALDELLISIGISRKSKLKSHFATLIDDLKYLPGVKLDVASKLYVSKHMRLAQKFKDRAKYIFDSSVAKVDVGMPSEAAHIINAWVSVKTNGMIKEIINSSDISNDASLIIVNAIYFAGQWKAAFHNLQTGTFFTPTGERIVKMMTRHAWYNYIKSSILDAQLVELPYKGDGAYFVILLPNKKNGLPTLLSQLKIAPELLDSELSKMRKVKVVLTIPKFKLESELDLRNLYEKIGLEEIFKTNNSGLEGIIRDISVFLSSAKQKAVIKVTELGTQTAVVSESQIIGISVDLHQEIINSMKLSELSPA